MSVRDSENFTDTIPDAASASYTWANRSNYNTVVFQIICSANTSTISFTVSVDGATFFDVQATNVVSLALEQSIATFTSGQYSMDMGGLRYLRITKTIGAGVTAAITGRAVHSKGGIPGSSGGGGGGGGTVGGTGVDNHIARWDGTADIQNSAPIIDDSGNVTAVTSMTTSHALGDGSATLNLNNTGTNAGSALVLLGSRAPDTLVSAPHGSIYIRSANASSSLYQNDSVGTGTSWAQFGIGSSVLTTNGDILYYDGGDTRRAIGSAGQTLEVTAGFPVWTSTTPNHIASTSNPHSVDMTDVTVTTTRGDVITRGATIDQRLAIGTAGQTLESDGTDPAWTSTTPNHIASTGNPHSVDMTDVTVTTTRGDIIARGVAIDQRLGLGTAGQTLESDGTDPTWTSTTANHIASTSNPHTVTITQANTAESLLSGNVDIPYYTGAAMAAVNLPTTGDIIYKSASGTLDQLAIGTAGQVLTVTGGLPIWGTAASNSDDIYRYYGASDFLNPTNSDWVINALAPSVIDSNNTALTVRAFDSTTAEGIGWMIYIPPGKTNMRLRLVWRAAVAATSTVNVDIRFRTVGDGALPSIWVADPQNAFTIATTNDLVYHYTVNNDSLSNRGLTAGTLYQFELTRDTSDPYTDDWLLLSLIVEIN